MTLAELKAALDEAGIRHNAYSLEGGLPDNRYTLEQRGGIWYVYYAERGAVTWEVTRATEEEACAVFLEELRSDPTAHKQEG